MIGRLEITHEEVGEAVVVVLRGPAGADGAGELERHLEDLIERGHRSFVLDLAAASGVGSAVLRVLLALQRKLASGQGGMALCGLQDEAREALELAGLARLLAVRPSRDAALSTLPAVSRPARVAALAARILSPGRRGELAPAERDLGVEARARLARRILLPSAPAPPAPEPESRFGKAFDWMRHRSD